MIVADTSLIASFYLETELTSLAKKVHKKVPIWIFPPIWREEYANVLTKFARKDSSLTEKKVISHLEYTISELEKYEKSVSLSATVQCALQHKISVYDAHFVQLAMEHDLIVVTEDQEIIKKCPVLAMSMEAFIAHG